MVIVLQALHVFFGILWFGGALFSDFVVIPATNKIDAIHANAFTASYGKQAEKVMAPVSMLTLLFGIILGFPLGAWSNIGHTYGNTYLLGFIIALLVALWGILMIGPNAKKLSTTDPGPKFDVLVSKVKRYTFIEMFGFFVIFVIMVALRYGY